MGERGRREVRAVVPDWPHSSALAALDELVQVAGATTDSLARRARLSHTELDAMRHLMQQDIGPAELARSLHVTSAAATGIVDRLESRGHVQRAAHPSDRRRTRVEVTESGRQEVLSLLSPMFQGLARADAELSPTDREMVTRFLRSATRAMQALDEGLAGGSTAAEPPAAQG